MNQRTTYHLGRFTRVWLGVGCAVLAALLQTGCSSSSSVGAVSAPAFSPGSGTYSLPQVVTIADDTANATIYYTTDGSMPTSASTAYTGPLTLTSQYATTIMAVAVANGKTSPSAVAAYTLSVAAPAISPAGGSYNSVQTVSLSSPAAGAVLYYTLDGSTPTAASTRYTAPITVAKSQTISAIAVVTGFTTSPVATAAYSITLPIIATPVISPAAGTYTSAQSVSITEATSGAAIFYTTDGTVPTSSSTQYTGPFAVSKSQTVSAIGILFGYTNSAIATAAYQIVTPVGGSVKSGTQPVKGAKVNLYAAGGTGYGSAATSLGSSTTDSNGNFSIPFVCPSASSQTYAVAVGGQVGSASGNNSALAMMTALGACSGVSASTNVYIDEASTVAGVWSLQQFASATFGTANSFNIGSSASNATGLANAFAAVNNIADISAGTIPATTAFTKTINGTPVTVNVLNEQSKVTTLANILASCVESADAPVGTASSACTTLFNAVKPASQSAAPVDTLQVALDLARNPTNVGSASVAPFSLAASPAPYTPGLSAAPTDYTLGLAYNSTTVLGATGSQSYFLSGALQLNVGTDGNVYVLTGPATTLVSPFDSVSVLSPSGSPVASFYGGAVLYQPRGMALDTNNNMWIANQGTVTPANALIELTQAGTVNAFTQASGLYGIAIDGRNNVFVGSNPAQQLLMLTGGTGTLKALGTVTGPEVIAIDSASNIWSVGFSTTYLAKFAATCGATTCTYVGPTQYTGLSSPFGLAIDGNDVPWVGETAANVVFKMNPATPANGGTSTAVKFGGISSPQYMASDGAGNIWIANSSPASVTELAAGSTTAVLSPAAGYAHTYNAPKGIAIDMSGNVWVGDGGATNAAGSYSVTEIVGAAAPAVQPLSNAVALGKVGRLP